MAQPFGQAHPPVDRPPFPDEGFLNASESAEQDDCRRAFNPLNCGQDYFPPNASSAMAMTASSSVRMASIRPIVTGSWVLMKYWALLSCPS